MFSQSHKPSVIERNKNIQHNQLFLSFENFFMSALEIHGSRLSYIVSQISQDLAIFVRLWMSITQNIV